MNWEVIWRWRVNKWIERARVCVVWSDLSGFNFFFMRSSNLRGIQPAAD